jgi:2-dehydropantoate 2-reductase
MSELRIVVVGAGATGGAFGTALATAGRDVTFLVRPKRAAALRERGLRVYGVKEMAVAAPKVVETGAVRETYDVVLLGLKAYQLAQAIDDFAPAVGAQTMIVPMLNGMLHMDRLNERFGRERVLGGVCHIASALDADGNVKMLFDMMQLTYGEQDGGISERVRALDAMMQHAGFVARASAQIVQEMWDKWVFLASLGAATCLMRGTIGAIEAAGGADLALAVLAEAAAVATANGYPPSPEPFALARERLSTPGSNLASSMYRDLVSGNPVEADHIVGDLIARGRAHGVETPLLRAAYVQLAIYQRERAG